MSDPLIEVNDLRVTYDMGRDGLFGRRRRLAAVDGVSFELGRGETLGLVGESGSGKSTTGRAVLRRAPISGGTVRFDGQDITHYGHKDMRRIGSRMQMIFQDPYASLNPKMRVAEIVAEPLLAHRVVRSLGEARPMVAELLEQTGLSTEVMDRLPHAFSGGQRQRIGIARALALKPDFLVADEPVSALDVSIRAQVVNLLSDLREQLGLSYLFIAHDLTVVRHISHRIAIMYAGRIVELAPRDELYAQPRHPYTETLLSAVPSLDPDRPRMRERKALKGETADPTALPSGCSFRTRCPYAQPGLCDVEAPPLRELPTGHAVACHLAEEIELRSFAPLPPLGRRTPAAAESSG